jgi:hypothetical protein
LWFYPVCGERERGATVERKERRGGERRGERGERREERGERRSKRVST